MALRMAMGKMSILPKISRTSELNCSVFIPFSRKALHGLGNPWPKWKKNVALVTPSKIGYINVV